jgi:phosphoribosyl-AMP cyclohydrolase
MPGAEAVVTGRRRQRWEFTALAVRRNTHARSMPYAAGARWLPGNRPDAARHNGPMDSPLDAAVAARLKRNSDGLMPAIAQQYDTGEVLMLGWMDDEALHRTLSTGRCTYWSRSRREYWVKGDTSGHVQHVKSVALDCDGDTILVRVDQVGAACHTGDRTCFDSGTVPLG